MRRDENPITFDPISEIGPGNLDLNLKSKSFPIGGKMKCLVMIVLVMSVGTVSAEKSEFAAAVARQCKTDSDCTEEKKCIGYEKAYVFAPGTLDEWPHDEVMGQCCAKEGCDE